MSESVPEDDPSTGLSVEDLCTLYRNDNEHSAFVSKMATRLFESTRDVHELPDDALEQIQTGAMLHNVGLYFGVPRHHIRSKEIILQHGLSQFSERDTHVIALIALFHRGKVRPRREPLFCDLDAETQRLALRAAAIVRIADGLDYSQDQSTKITNVDRTRRSIRITVSNKSAGAWDNAARANEKAEMWRDAMPRPMRFAVDAGQKYYLRRGDTMQAAGFKVLSHFFDALCENEEGTRARTDPEDLHQFRVATRRLRASLRPFRGVFGRDAVEPFIEDLRAIAAATGDVRDLDVFVAALEELPSSSRVPTFLSHLRRRHDEAVAHMLAVFDAEEFAQFKERFAAFLANAHPYGNRDRRKGARELTRVAASRTLSKRLQAVLKYRGNLDLSDDTQLHALRIACKRFRYVADFFCETLAVKPSVVLRPMKALQDSLGEVHDAAVREEYMLRFLDEHQDTIPVDERSALADLAHENEQQRAKYHAEFQQQWEDFVSDAFQARLRAGIDPDGRHLADG